MAEICLKLTRILLLVLMISLILMELHVLPVTCLFIGACQQIYVKSAKKDSRSI